MTSYTCRHRGTSGFQSMRATVHRALALAAPSTAMDVTLLIAQLRGHVELMVTEVEPLAAEHAGRARRRLPGRGSPQARRRRRDPAPRLRTARLRPPPGPCPDRPV
ncbi:DUF6415 family natural product biosynthesis protein [Streptomyces sp. NBC_01288]|uniref:DUF6415 family natural product biosynthesis protein n=1 Tax=Streptomyces sp. NBC_01288 TaxID=2903814 RepID=UPI003FA3C171